MLLATPEGLGNMNVNTPATVRDLQRPVTAGSGQRGNGVGQKHSTILSFIPKTIRAHVVAMIGEYVGTLLFLFFAFAGTQVANVSSNTNTNGTVITKTEQKNPAQLLYISLSFGFSLAVNAWVFFRISGGLFNPAVSEDRC